MKIDKNLKYILLFASLMQFTVCFSQLYNYDISGSWKAMKGELVTSIVNGRTEIREVDIYDLQFVFKEKTVSINRAFEMYSSDSIYTYSIMDTVPRNHHFWSKIRVKSFDENNMIIEMKYLGRIRADRVMWYNLYLKQD